MRALVCALAFLFACWIECLRPEYAVRVDEAIRDVFLLINADKRPETRLTVVDISEDALVEVGAWPWSRGVIADLVEASLGRYGARAVALDIVLPEPADVDDDQRLAILAAHAPLVLAQVFDYAPRSQVLTLGRLSGGFPAAPAESGAVLASGYIANHVGLVNARCVGNIGYTPDVDGVLRRIPVLTYYQGRVYPHLADALQNCAEQPRLENERMARAVGAFWRVPYRYSPSSYTVVSAADVLKGRVPVSLLQGRYVLVGSSALGLGDRVSTPLSSLSAGVMVHAASLSGQLDISESRAYAPWSGRAVILGWTLLSVIAAVILMANLSAWSSIVVLIFCMLIWLALALAGVLHQAEGSIFAPLSAYFVLLLSAVPHEWWRSQHTAKRLLNTFSHYVAKPVLDELLRIGGAHSLAPTLREVTVLIADMEGYTRMTSSLPLDDAATLTKDFLDCLTRPVLARLGTLDKYTGDGLVAFWGAPLECLDQADRAVESALAILEEVRALNVRRQNGGGAPVRVRIGVESGKALVGDLGTPFRSTYTAVGDCINFASRLEEVARDLPTDLVIGPVTNDLLVQNETISLGRHSLRGTQTAIELFTVRPR